ncbi:MAG: tRNA (adenosine(37)-N6)-dimethylallyltransferase MiaA, partial [Clostridia bacterium]|nr:tRNA (adenosine(37)-N6)-dimethylallyltransferase MiaA [Clostridia bacterium]
MKLARILDGVIISADSMQIYKTLDIGTAKESIENRREIQHEMIDVVPVDSEYSVAEYSIDARRCIKNALDKNKTPIIVGGTGLYFESLFYPM